MKKLIITGAMLMFISSASFAQTVQNGVAATDAKKQPTRPTLEQISERRAKSIQKQYSLSDEQYKGIYSVELDQMKQRDEMRKNKTKPAKDQMMQMKMARDQKYKSIMNADQYAKFEAAQPKQNQPK